MSRKPPRPRSQQAKRPRPAPLGKTSARPRADSKQAGGGAPQTGALPPMHRSRINETRVFAVLFAISLFFLQSPWGTDGLIPQALRWAGYVLIILCVLGRTWSASYIGGQKARVVVDRGPYSVTRNPLYVFSFLGAVGIGCSTGMMTPALVIGAVYVVYYRMIVAREEEHLAARHSAEYADYVARVPRWIPDFKLWVEADQPMGYPRNVYLAARDASAFFVAWPLFAFIGWLQDSGILPVLFRLP